MMCSYNSAGENFSVHAPASPIQRHEHALRMPNVLILPSDAKTRIAAMRPWLECRAARFRGAQRAAERASIILAILV